MSTAIKITVAAEDTYKLKIIYAVGDKAEKVIWAEPGVEQTITFEPGSSDNIRIVKEKV